MAGFSELIDIDWLMGVLDEQKPIEEIIGVLEEKGFELGQQIDSIEALEGEVIHKGDLRILPLCPMTPLLKAIMERYRGKLPDSFHRIVESYRERHPQQAAVLHPLCIVHQTIRKTFGMAHDEYFEEVACRSLSSAEVVISEQGLVMSGLTEDEAREIIKDAACLYFVGT